MKAVYIFIWHWTYTLGVVLICEQPIGISRGEIINGENKKDRSFKPKKMSWGNNTYVYCQQKNDPFVLLSLAFIDNIINFSSEYTLVLILLPAFI